MDYIDSLLIMEDDLDNANDDGDDAEVCTPVPEASVAIEPPPPHPSAEARTSSRVVCMWKLPQHALRGGKSVLQEKKL